MVSNKLIPLLSPCTNPSSIAREFNVLGLALGTGALALSIDAQAEAQIIPDSSLETLLEVSVEPILPSNPYPNTTPLSIPTKQDSTSQTQGLNPLSLSTHTVCC